MSDADADADAGRGARGLLVLGRVLGTVAATFWVLAVVAGALGNTADESTVEESAVGEAVGIVVLVAVNAVAVGLGWWRPRFGGRLGVVGGSAFVVFALLTAGRNHLPAASVSGLPFLVAGLLVLLGSGRAP